MRTSDLKSEMMQKYGDQLSMLQAEPTNRVMDNGMVEYSAILDVEECRIVAYYYQDSEDVMQDDLSLLDWTIDHIDVEYQYAVRCRENGEVFEYCLSMREAEEIISRHEEEDKKSEVYEENYYEIAKL